MAKRVHRRQCFLKSAQCIDNNGVNMNFRVSVWAKSAPAVGNKEDG